MEGSPKCDLSVFLTKAMERCVKALQKFYSQTEYDAFTSDPSSFRADQMKKGLLLKARKVIASLMFILYCYFKFLCISDFLRILH